MKRILFERSGGFMGRKLSLDLDLDQLPPDQVEMLVGLVMDADFFSLPGNLSPKPNPDAFHYTITIELEGSSHSVKFSDTTSPPSLQPLLVELSSRARPKPKPFIPPAQD